MLSSKGVSADPAKVEVVKNLAASAGASQPRSF